MKTWWPRLIRYALRHAAGLGGVGLLMAGSIGFDLLKPWPLKLIVDSVGRGHELSPAAAAVARVVHAHSTPVLLLWLTAATVLCFMISWALRVAQAWLQTLIGTSLVYELAGDLFRNLQRLSLGYHARRQTGDLVRQVTADCTCARDLLLNVLVPAASSLCTLTGMAAVLWRLDRPLTLLAVLIVPPLGICIWLFAGPMGRCGYEQAAAQGAAAARAHQVLSSIVLVRSFNRERFEEEQFAETGKKADQAGLRTLRAQLRFKLSTGAITSAGMAGVMALGGFHVLQGQLTLGSLLVFLSYLQSFYGPLETLAYLSTGLANAAAGARRVFEVLDSPERVVEPRSPNELPTSGPRVGEVRFLDVTFGYTPERAVLENIQFTVQPGETVGIAGASGAGKSALVSLIPRLFDPWQGRVLVNGRDVRTVSLAALRAQVAIVLQDDFILPVSVVENIAFGQPQATREAIEEAARAADAHAFITRLPAGYDTILSDRGACLSGGERQRLAIARALLKRAPILVLDEPTSALDAETEYHIIRRLQRSAAFRTVIVVAHRLSTIRHADRILVLHAGRIVENGTHGELLRGDSGYARLHHLQNSAWTPHVSLTA